MRFLGLQALRRNWYVAVIGIVVTLGLVGAASVTVSAKYVVTSQLVLLPPLAQKDASYNNVANPYLGLDGLDDLANVVSLAMTDADTSRALSNAGVTDYSVTYDSLSAGPILVVQTEASSAQEASAANAEVTSEVPTTLARLQREAAIQSHSFVSTQVVARPTAPTRSGKTQLRAMAVAFVVGLLLTLLAIAVLDSWRVRQQLRRNPGDPPAKTAGTTTDSAAVNGAVPASTYQHEPAAAGTYRSDASTSGKFTSGSFAGDSFTSDSFANDSFARGSYSADSFTGDSLSGDSFTGDSFTDDAETAEAVPEDADTAASVTDDASTPDTVRSDADADDTEASHTAASDTDAYGVPADSTAMPDDATLVFNGVAAKSSWKSSDGKARSGEPSNTQR